jgi:hypothetical protein
VVEFKQKSDRGSNMANDLVRLNPHIDHMRQQLSQTAETERSLVQTLGDALKRFDQETLQNVRNLAAEHEARRAGILNELQALAAGIGTFQPPHETVQPAAISQENGHPHAVGDWRQATKNLSYQDELELLLRNGHLNGNSSPQ